MNTLMSRTLCRLLLLAALVSATARAATYYVSSSTGNDTNNGLSAVTPWKTIAKISATQFAPGDSVLFKRGETWKDGTLLSFTESGDPARPIVIAAYGAGNKPVITDIKTLAGSTDSTAWVFRAGNIWAMRYRETPNRLWLDGVEALRAAIAQDVGTVNSQGAFEHWYFDAADSTLLLSAPRNPALAYGAIEGNHPAGVLALYGSAYVVFDGIDFRGGKWSTIYGGACSFITFRDCCVGYGNSGLTLTSADPAGSSHDVLVDRCIFDSGLNFHYGLSSLGPSTTIDATKRGSEDGIHFGEAVHDCTVRYCVFTGWGHCAINCYAPDSTRDGIYRNTFHDNTLNGSNLSYARPFATDGAEGKCHHNEFRNNVVRDHTVRSQMNGNDNWIHNNIFDGMTTSPAKYFGSEGSAHAIGLSVYGLHLVSHDNRIENNLFMRTEEEALTFWSYGFPNKVRGHRVRNNIFFDAGYATALAADSGVAILMRDTLEVFGNEFRNNCIFSPRAPASSAVKYYGTRMSVADFNARQGRYGNDIAANLQVDPLLIDPAAADCHLRPSPPCIDAGMRIPDITRDLDGNPVFVGTAPDIGPYEYPAASGVGDDALPAVRCTIHPNPCVALATITFQAPVSRGVVRVFDILGAQITEKRECAGASVTLPTGRLSRGMYILRVEEDGRCVAAGILMLK
jgi:hypothetical protein